MEEFMTTGSELKDKIQNTSLPPMPWEDKPDNYPMPFWRYSGNPVIDRLPHLDIDSIYNSALVPFEGRYAGVFRCDDLQRRMTLRAGFSKDGINFKINSATIVFETSEPEISQFIESYDPRVLWLEDRYYITWCNNYHGYTIGLAYTHDFKSFYQLENSFLPYNRNGVLFPRKIKGKYMMLSRPSDTAHTPFGDIFISQSPDLIYWGKHRFLMGPQGGYGNWENTKVGAGPVPIETPRGWLLFYHGVINSCNGFTYSMGAALLDLDEPWKLIKRSKRFLITPNVQYEYQGNTPNVVFPCSALYDSQTGRIAIYYGAADTCTALAFGNIDEIFDWMEKE